MDYAPSIDWTLALRLSAAGAKDLPDLDERSLKQLVADLRVTARRAGEIAGAFLNVDSAGATAVKVVDWNGWGTAVRGMVETVVAELDMPHRPDGPVDWARRRINAVLLGAGIRAASRRLLGQYDAYTGADTLYLVAPTIVAHERDHGFAPADFRLWVALHEQTHALQFRAAPGCGSGSDSAPARSSRTTPRRSRGSRHGRAPVTSPRCSSPATRGSR